jgi:hypothetical protein
MMTLKGATIIDTACLNRRGTIISANPEAGTVLVLWPGGGYNIVNARRDPGRYQVVVA